MKNLIIFLSIAFAEFIASICFGQELAKEKGLVLTYKIGAEKIGSRYEEYCKTTFDIYPVEGKVVNTSADEAAVVTAILSFEGKACNKIYSNDNITTGEIIDKSFNLDIWGQSGRPTHYWVNRYVHLLPGDSMRAKGHVEVKQGEKVDKPDKYFVVDLVPSKVNISTNLSEDSNIGTNSSNANELSTRPNNYARLIIGEWQITREAYVYCDGKEVERGELFNAYIYNSNGIGTYLGNGETDEITYTINGNKFLMTGSDGSKWDSEILKLDGSTLILKHDYPDKDDTKICYLLSVYTKVKK